MFKKTCSKKYFAFDAHRYLHVFICIILSICFSRTSGRTKVGDRYFIEWIIVDGRLVKDQTLLSRGNRRGGAWKTNYIIYKPSLYITISSPCLSLKKSNIINKRKSSFLKTWLKRLGTFTKSNTDTIKYRFHSLGNCMSALNIYFWGRKSQISINYCKIQNNRLEISSKSTRKGFE